MDPGSTPYIEITLNFDADLLDSFYLTIAKSDSMILEISVEGVECEIGWITEDDGQTFSPPEDLATVIDVLTGEVG